MKMTTYSSPTLDGRTLLEECRALGACSQGVEWLRVQLHYHPNATLPEIRDLLRKKNPPTYMDSEGRKRVDISAIRGWEAWVCRYVLRIECSTGTYSGARGVFSGPDVDNVDLR